MLYTPSTLPIDALQSIAPAFDDTYRQGAEHWIEQCRRDLAQFWRSDDGKYSAVTEVIDTPRGRVFHMVASAGEFRRELVEEAETWAITRGCAKVLTEGRPGWQRVLRDYRLTNVTLEKEL